MRELRFFGKRKPRSHRKTNRRDLRVVPRQRRAPVGGHVLSPLPQPGSMAQRPPMPPRTVHAQVPPSPELIEAVNRLTGSFGSQFRLKDDVPLFSGDDMTWAQYDERRLERLRRMQDLEKTWPDAHGVNLGSHGPQTLVFSTTDYPRFSDGTGTIPAVKR